MKKYNLKITPLAEQDLTNIGDYIALELKNPSAALNTIKGIQQIITNLQFIPERYHLEIHMLADDRAWLYSTLKPQKFKMGLLAVEGSNVVHSVTSSQSHPAINPFI